MSVTFSSCVVGDARHVGILNLYICKVYFKLVVSQHTELLIVHASIVDSLAIACANKPLKVLLYSMCVLICQSMSPCRTA